MTTKNRVRAWQGAGMLILGIASLSLDAYTALPALIWARWLEPFDRAGRVGYGLCWFSITAWAPVIFLKSDVRMQSWPLDLWNHGYVFYAASVLAWLFVAGKFVERPARSLGRAILIAIGGTLLVCPVIAWTTGALTMPLWLGLKSLTQMAADVHGEGVRPVLAYLVKVILIVIAAFLSAYWPARPQTTRPLSEAQREIPEMTRWHQVLLCYLVACLCFTVLINPAANRNLDLPLLSRQILYWAGSPVYVPWDIGTSFLNLLFPDTPASGVDRLMTFIGKLLALLAPLAMSWWLLYGRLEGIAGLFGFVGEARVTRRAILSGSSNGASNADESALHEK